MSEYQQWSEQINATVAELERRTGLWEAALAGLDGAVERHQERTDAALAELGRRLDALERRVERLDAHSSEMAKELLDVIEHVDRVREGLDRHTDAHWRSGR